MRELSLKESERFIDHILVCGKCRKKFEMLKQLSGELSGKMDVLEADKLSSEEMKELKDLARKKIRQSKRRDAQIFGWIPVKYAAAAAVLIAAAAGLYAVLHMGQREVYRQEGKKPVRQQSESDG
jgi:anti-sigma factor RsiW